MFTGDLHRRLSLGKYTQWAADLTEDELVAVLWAVGEYGARAQAVTDCVDRHAGEFFPCDGLHRSRLALGQLSRMVAGERIGFEALGDEVRAAIYKWRSETGQLQE